MESVYVDQHFNLVVECKQGNRKAQYELYRLYSKAMYNIAMRIVNNEFEAADILQEAFLDAFTRIADFRQETTFGMWLKQIVINKAINHLRKRRIDFISIENADDIPETEQTDEDDILYKVHRVRQTMQLLPDGYRVVISLYLLEGYDHEEISHILKISENTSRSQFMRAKRKLVEMLKDN